MSLIGAAIGAADLKIRKKLADKTGNKGQYYRAKKRFEKYMDFNEKMGYPGIGWVLTVAASPLLAARAIHDKVEKKKEAERQEENTKRKNQERAKARLQAFESEKEIAQACAKMVESTTACHSVDFLKNKKIGREVISMKGLNVDSLQTVFGESLKTIAVLNGKGNVIFVSYFDDVNHIHYVFLERNLETGNFSELADLTSDQAIGLVNKAFESIQEKIKAKDKTKRLQTIQQLTNSERK